MKHTLRLFALVLIALALLASGPRPAAAAEASPFGVNVHIPQGPQLAFTLDRAQAAGIGWVRIDFIWAVAQPARNRYDWSAYDALAQAARTRGINVYASLAYTPGWATSGPELTGVPANPADWADFCGQAARRYRGSIRYWGVWNEPNLTRFWSGTRQQYLDLILKPCADAIHAAAPEAQVGGPDLAHLTSGDSDWYDWLRETITQAGDRLDFVTHHLYDTDGNRDVTDKLEGSTLFGSRPSLWGTVPPTVEEVLRYTGWYGKPFWLTETGWESARIGEDRQATYYAGLLSDWFSGNPSRSWIDKMFFYEMQDPGGSGAPTYGILRPDGSAKPAYQAYRNFIVTSGPSQDDAVIVSDTLPNQVEAGQVLDIQIRVRNTGSTTWTRAGGYALGAGPDDADPFSPLRQPLEVGESIAPGQEKTFTLHFQAPASPGNYGTDWQMVREGGSWFGATLRKIVTVNAAPSAAQRSLGLLGGRYGVEVSWRDQHNNRAGFGRAIPSSDQSGYFWFFDPSNVELVVKMLDGSTFNGYTWVFYGALSDVEYWITVTDHQTGKVRQYHNAPGNLCGRGDTTAFRTPVAPTGGTATAPLETAPEAAFEDLAQPLLAIPLEEVVPMSLAVPAPDTACTSSGQALCLLGSRFRIEVEWHDQHNSVSGLGHAVPGTDQTGYFWFFDPTNIELVVKTLDGRPLNNKFWVFYGALTDVEYWITVTDTVTGARKRYHNAPGNLCGKGDTQAL
ncbi:MAG TPA: NBR1-Ig-like domain-containing protein [Thermoanaerobaculia bacterium]|nr:NBR1-Ig-like domain-containing protein [Thermoanaerobaculia bacterium]